MPDPTGSWLDNIPAWARHLLIVVVGAALVTVSQGFAHGGVSEIDWQDVLNAAIGAAITYGLLLLTPLTQQYGIGAPPNAPVNVPPPAPPGE